MLSVQLADVDDDHAAVADWRRRQLPTPAAVAIVRDNDNDDDDDNEWQGRI